MIAAPRRACACPVPSDREGAEHHTDACNDAYVAHALDALPTPAYVHVDKTHVPGALYELAGIARP